MFPYPSKAREAVHDRDDSEEDLPEWQKRGDQLQCFVARRRDLDRPGSLFTGRLLQLEAQLTGMLRTSKSSTSDSGSNRRPSVASRRPSRGSTSSLRPKEQARALSKGSKPTKATGPYLGGESNKKEGIKI